MPASWRVYDDEVVESGQVPRSRKMAKEVGLGLAERVGVAEIRIGNRARASWIREGERGGAV